MESRDLFIKVWEELSSEKSMIFLSGPRQCGKTTLARIIARSFSNHYYFNWDIPEDRAKLIQNPAFFTAISRKDSTKPLIIFDEIHKYKDWKNYLKGVYDQYHKDYIFLVSGSGRLDLYQKGSDSLAGRYLLFHLWPFTIAELGKFNSNIEFFLKDPLKFSANNNTRLKKIWKNIEELGGFPEPYLLNKKASYRRWSNTYSRQLLREDIRDLTGIKSIRDIETLYMLLPSKVGSPISIPSLAQDLRVSYNSVQNWLKIFETYFLTFSISPWTKKISRAIHKEQKVYLWDTPHIQNPSARFENMVALELYRAITMWNDLGYGLFALHYIKDKEHREVDFLISNNNEPVLLIEVKYTDTTPAPALKKFQSILEIPAVQLINDGKTYRLLNNDSQKILVAPGFQWLAQLP